MLNVEEGLPTLVIILIVLISVLLLFLNICLVLCLIRRQKRKKLKGTHHFKSVLKWPQINRNIKNSNFG